MLIEDYNSNLYFQAEPWAELEKTREILKNENLGDYWLNRDGSCCNKKKWLHRLIRWLQNYFYDKTISDIWHVFEKVINQPPVTNQEQSVLLVIKFLESRKDKLSIWLNKNPKKMQFLESCLSSKSNDEWALSLLEEVYAYSKKLSNNALINTQTNKTKCLKETNINELSIIYNELPFSKNEHKKAVEFIELIEKKEGNFDHLLNSIIEVKVEKKIFYIESNKKPSFLECWHLVNNNRSLTMDTKGPRKFLLLEAFSEYVNRLASALVVEEKENNALGFDSLKNEALALDVLEKALSHETIKTSWLKDVFTKSLAFNNFIQDVDKKNGEVFGIEEKNRNMFYETIKFYLSGILHQLKSNKNLGKDKIFFVLNELAEASLFCAPRWLGESLKQYRYLASFNIQKVKKHVLKHIQELKEDVFLELFSNQQFHILNTFKNHYGSEIGLENRSSLLDLFAQHDVNNGSIEEIKRCFLETFHKRIIAGIRTRIKAQIQDNFDPGYIDFLISRIKKNNPKSYVKKNYVESGSKALNSKGVMFLLQELKILV